MEAHKPSGGVYEYEIATFSRHSDVVSTATDDLSKLRHAIAQITLGYPNPPGSDIMLAATLPHESTNFASYATWRKYFMQLPENQGFRHFVILVTDGAVSMPGGTFAKGTEHEFLQSDCDKLKSTGATVGVIYTKYLDDTGNHFFDQDVNHSTTRSSRHCRPAPASRTCSPRATRRRRSRMPSRASCQL